MLPTTQRPVKFMLRYETRVDNLHKKHAALHAHIPSRRRQTVLGAGLLEGGGSASPRLDKEAAAAAAKIAWTCLDHELRSQTHLFPTYAYEGILHPPCDQKLLAQEEAA
jgi:hypothetical protein